MPKELNFFEQVYELVSFVPQGKVTSYGAIAAYLGSKGSARMVGWALNSSHSSKKNIPAHRVVNRNGQLSAKRHFGGPDIMQQLLESEGVSIIDDQIQDFENHFWDPAKEL